VVKLPYNEAKEEQHMSKRPRRNHAPAFKAKVAVDALKGEQTLVELSQRYQIHPNPITEWKKQLLEHAPDIFSKDRKPEQGPSAKDMELMRQIDEIHLAYPVKWKPKDSQRAVGKGL
jgi:transposase